MDTKDREAMAGILRRAAALTIPEAQFWAEFYSIAERVKEPIVNVALEAANAYWDKFHSKKLLRFIPTSPTSGELRQGRDELKLIAAVLETGWQLPSLGEEGSEA